MSYLLKHCPFLKIMDSIYKHIGRLQETYWTILRGLSRKSQVYKTVYDSGHKPFKKYGFVLLKNISKKESTGIFQETKHHINSLYWINWNEIFLDVVWILLQRLHILDLMSLSLFSLWSKLQYRNYTEEYCVKHFAFQIRKII